MPNPEKNKHFKHLSNRLLLELKKHFPDKEWSSYQYPAANAFSISCERIELTKSNRANAKTPSRPPFIHVEFDNNFVLLVEVGDGVHVNALSAAMPLSHLAPSQTRHEFAYQEVVHLMIQTIHLGLYVHTDREGSTL